MSPSQEDQTICGLWLGKSTATENSLGLFVGVDISSGDSILQNGGEPHIPVYDTNRNEWSSIQDAVWNSGIVAVDTLLQVDFNSHSFLPGVGLLATCHDSLANIHLHPTEEVDSLGVHRHSDPLAGSFTYRQHSEFVASEPLEAGQELMLNCKRANQISSSTSKNKTAGSSHQSTLSELEQSGICLDNLLVRPSTIPKAGRGAFAKRSVKKGNTITTSPVIAFDRSQTYLVEQEMDHDGTVAFGEVFEGNQLLTNYCYSHPDSNVLLLPTGPGVNYINHHASKANVVMRWSDSPLNGQTKFLNISDTEVMAEAYSTMILDFVALTDIEAGDEIFLHYGDDWIEFLNEYTGEVWESPPFSSKYVSAAEYQRGHPDKPIQTLAEQRQKKYPRNIETTCLFLETIRTGPEETVTWTDANEDCLRPCRILERSFENDGQYSYTAEVLPIPNEVGNRECHLAKTHKIVNQIPAKAVFLTDRPYTTDEHMPGAFRHTIEASSGLYPDPWLKDDPTDMGAFLQPELEPGQIEPIRWKSNGKPITDNAYIIGLPSKVRKSLLRYCADLRITEYFRELTYRGNGLDFEEDETKTFGGLKWEVQRPPMRWNSNMHWISPNNAATHLDFLQELGIAGFDEVLKRIGEHFDMDGLAVYHLSFIAVSHCSDGFIHKDIAGSGGKVFNIIIPLILAEDTGPELDVSEGDKNGLIGRMRYQYDVATMMGDNAYHGTSAADYRATREMRMAATIYIADINDANIDSIMKHYTQHFPPSDQPSVLLKMAGAHWKADDPSVALPEYTPNLDEEEEEEDENDSDDEYWDDD